MDFKLVESLVKTDVSNFLKPYKYSYDKNIYSYLKKTENGFIGVSCPLSNYSPLFKLGFTFFIRINEVEDIYGGFGRIVPAYQKYSSTIIISYDFFKKKQYFQCHFYNEKELAFVLNDFKALFQEEIMPFLDKLSVLAYLNDLIHNKQMELLDSTVKPDNYIHWIIISKINNAANANFLADTYLTPFLNDCLIEKDRKRVINFMNYLGNSSTR